MVLVAHMLILEACKGTACDGKSRERKLNLQDSVRMLARKLILWTAETGQTVEMMRGVF